MTRKATRNAGAPTGTTAPATPSPAAALPAFYPVHRRHRHDGWPPERQVALIEALADCGCIEAACARVGMSVRSAYTLRLQEDAASFRNAWDIALDQAVRRLTDSAFSRALDGVSCPIFYRGEQIGERRYYDERLAMFLLRYRDPQRYGDRQDACEPSRAVDEAARDLAAVLADMVGEEADRGTDRSVRDQILVERVAYAKPHGAPAGTRRACRAGASGGGCRRRCFRCRRSASFLNFRKGRGLPHCLSNRQETPRCPIHRQRSRPESRLPRRAAAGTFAARRPRGDGSTRTGTADT